VPDDPPVVKTRCLLSPGVVRVTYADPASFEKAQREELSKGRLYVACGEAAPRGTVALFLEVPGRPPERRRAEVVMVAGAEQARAWGLAPGFALALAKEAAPVAVATSPGRTAATLLANLEPKANDAYALLGLTPEAEMSEVRHALTRREQELSQARLNADPGQAARLQALQARLAQVRGEIGEPLARARHDGRCGHFRAVARALASGLTAEQLGMLHADFAVCQPERVKRAAEEARAAEMHQRVRDLARAASMYEHALSLDPLDLSLQQRYWALKRAMSSPSAALRLTHEPSARP
jgi:hypothetical protein